MRYMKTIIGLSTGLLIGVLLVGCSPTQQLLRQERQIAKQEAALKRIKADTLSTQRTNINTTGFGLGLGFGAGLFNPYYNNYGFGNQFIRNGWYNNYNRPRVVKIRRRYVKPNINRSRSNNRIRSNNTVRNVQVPQRKPVRVQRRPVRVQTKPVRVQRRPVQKQRRRRN